MATKSINTKLKLEGEAEFNDQIKAINSNLKTLRSDMKVVTATYDDNGSSIAALNEKQKILDQTQEESAKKVALLKARYDEACKAYGENSSAAQRYKQQLNSATVAEMKAADAAKANAEAIKEAKAAAGPYITVTQRMVTALKNLGTSVKTGAKNILDFAHHIPVVGEAMDVAAGSAKLLWGALKLPVNLINSLGKGADKIKQFTENFKKMGEAAKIVGAPITAAGNQVKNFVGGIGKITAVSMGAAAALGSLGVVGLKMMTDYAKQAAEAAKAAQEAGEPLTDTQAKWLAFSGQLDALDASVASAKAALGGVLLPVLSDLSEEGAQFMSDFAADMEAASGDVSKQGQVMAEYIGKGAQLIKTKLPEYMAVGKELLKGLGEGLAEEGPELLEMGFDLLTELLDSIIEFAPQMGDGAVQLMNTLIEGLGEKGPDLLTSAVEMVTSLVAGLAQAAPDMIPAAANLVVTLITALVQAAPDLLLAGLELIYGIISGISDGLGDIVGAADTIIQTAKDAFAEKAGEFMAVGDNIVKGIWNGISAGKDWIFGKISEWVGDVVNWIKSKLGISSPSRVMKQEVGYWMARGIGSGFAEEMAAVNREIAASINTSFDIPRPVRSSAYGRYYATSQGNVINLYITAKQITEADISLICDTINRKLGDAM